MISSGATYFVKVFVQSGSYFVFKLSYVTYPPALAQETQIVSDHPFGLVCSPVIIKSGVPPNCVLSTVPAHPSPSTLQNVIGHKVGFVLSKNRSYAFPKFGEAFVTENSKSGIVGVAFFVRVD